MSELTQLDKWKLELKGFADWFKMLLFAIGFFIFLAVVLVGSIFIFLTMAKLAMKLIGFAWS